MLWIKFQGPFQLLFRQPVISGRISGRAGGMYIYIIGSFSSALP